MWFPRQKDLYPWLRKRGLSVGWRRLPLAMMLTDVCSILYTHWTLFKIHKKTKINSRHLNPAYQLTTTGLSVAFLSALAPVSAYGITPQVALEAFRIRLKTDKKVLQFAYHQSDGWLEDAIIYISYLNLTSGSPWHAHIPPQLMSVLEPWALLERVQDGKMRELSRAILCWLGEWTR